MLSGFLPSAFLGSSHATQHLFSIRPVYHWDFRCLSADSQSSSLRCTVSRFSTALLFGEPENMPRRGFENLLITGMSEVSMSSSDMAARASNLCPLTRSQLASSHWSRALCWSLAVELLEFRKRMSWIDRAADSSEMVVSWPIRSSCGNVLLPGPKNSTEPAA